MRARAIIAAFMLLAGCGGGNHVNSAPAPTWQAGPVIGGRDYSAGTALTEAGDEVIVEIPQAPASTHYVTRAMSLAGKSKLVLRYRVEMAGRIVPVGYPKYQQARITLYFQRRGDNWSCAGKYDPYRWYATFASQRLDATGEFVMEAPLDGAWTGCQAATRAGNPAEFAAAVNDTARVGVVFGGGDGYGHGVYALGGPARVTFSLEIK